MSSQRKATDQQIQEAYALHGNVWKAGKTLGLCGQSIQERLVKLGIPRKAPRTLSGHEKQLILTVYQSGFVRGDGKLQALSSQIDRTVPFISRYARSVGLTSCQRSRSKEEKQRCRDRMKQWHKTHAHPKGMKGKKHTKETLKMISLKSKESNRRLSPERKQEITLRVLKTKAANGTLLSPRKASWKSSWEVVDGRRIFFRSSWEHKYALILEIWKGLGAVKAWEHEPETFWFEKIKRGVRSYTPDFKVFWTDGRIEYHEVKGWMDGKSKTKLKRMAKYHPSVKMVLIDAVGYKILVKRWL